MVTPVKKAPAKKVAAKDASVPASKPRMTDAEKALADKLAAAKTAQNEAAKLAKEAADEKAKQKKAAEAETAKIKKAAAEKVAKEKAEKALEPAKKEINTRFEKAEKLGVQADDHRLAAAMRLAKVKDECREAGLSYKDWCAVNLKVSEQTIRKMLPVGAAENETKGAGALMLEDMRNKNKDANKKSRDKKAAEASSGGGSSDKTTERKVTPWERAQAAADALPAEEKRAFVDQQAGKMDAKVVDINAAPEKATSKTAAPASTKTPLEAAEDAFRALAPRRRIAFVYWAADLLDGKFVPAEGKEDDTGEGADEDITDIPDSLKR